VLADAQTLDQPSYTLAARSTEQRPHRNAWGMVCYRNHASTSDVSFGNLQLSMCAKSIRPFACYPCDRSSLSDYLERRSLTTRMEAEAMKQAARLLLRVLS